MDAVYLLRQLKEEMAAAIETVVVAGANVQKKGTGVPETGADIRVPMEVLQVEEADPEEAAAIEKAVADNKQKDDSV